MSEPRRVVFYAVNGTGVGHLTRLLSIARWLRRLSAALDVPLECWFLTSSEADGLAFAEGFAAFKIPSKTIVSEAGIDKVAHRALAKQWVWQSLATLRPDLFVVDTFPRGSFGELLNAFDLCRRTAFVYRPVRREVAERPDFQAMLSLYDLILVPESDAEVTVPDAVKDRLVHVGPVLARERWEMLPREVARARLGVPDDRACVYVSAGGGGDAGAPRQLEWAIASLARDPSLSLVVGTGALYRGAPIPHVTNLPGVAAEWSLAFDAAVSAAGYNSFGELMFAGVPTAFLPQQKLADDQRARAERAVQAGAGAITTHDSDLAAVVRALVARPEAREAARTLVPENGARTAAAELLRLLVPAARVDAIEHALDGEALASLGTHERDGLRLAALLAGPGGDLHAALRAIASLAPHLAHAKELRGIVDAIARGAPTLAVGDRATLLRVVVDRVAPLRHGDGMTARHAVATCAWGGERSDAEALVALLRPHGAGSSSS